MGEARRFLAKNERELDMGCNAYNHPPWCNCGWGGATRWSHSDARIAPVRSIHVPDGLDWSRARRPVYETYVNPNARCPVCGAKVFFYQSPTGGRVFFDELVPPWPKHPCTDTYFRTAGPRGIMPTQGPPTAFRRPDADVTKWQPLVYPDFTLAEPFLVAPVDLPVLAGRTWLYVPKRLVEGRPVFWRRIEGDELNIEISTVIVALDGSVQSIMFPAVRGRFKPTGLDDRRITAKKLYELAWSVSFMWRHADTPGWIEQPGVDLALAWDLFGRSAERGYTLAWNSLGVMVRDGLGQKHDARQAAIYFRRALSSLHPVPFIHLANCLAEGSGAEPDARLSAFFRRLSERLQANVERENKVGEAISLSRSEANEWSDQAN